MMNLYIYEAIATARRAKGFGTKLSSLKFTNSKNEKDQVRRRFTYFMVSEEYFPVTSGKTSAT